MEKQWNNNEITVKITVEFIVNDFAIDWFLIICK